MSRFDAKFVATLTGSYLGKPVTLTLYYDSMPSSATFLAGEFYALLTNGKSLSRRRKDWHVCGSDKRNIYSLRLADKDEGDFTFSIRRISDAVDEADETTVEVSPIDPCGNVIRPTDPDYAEAKADSSPVDSRPSYEIAREKLAACLADRGATMECVSLLSRPGTGFDAKAMHRQCVIQFADGKSFTTAYSAGSGHAIPWAEKHGGPGLRLQIHYAKRDYGSNWSNLVACEKLMTRIYDAYKPDLVDVIASCLTDSPDIGQDFESWCDDYGYDSDSRKAEATFTACVAIGRDMRRIFGRDFDAMRDLAREL